MYGCRVIQKLIDVLPEENIIEIEDELGENYRKCIEDQNANHVIQKLIEKLENKKRNKLMDVIIQDVFDLCIHQYGCSVIQKIFDFL